MLRKSKAIKAIVLTITMAMLCSVFSIAAFAKVKPGYSEVPTIGNPSPNPTSASITEWTSGSSLESSKAYATTSSVSLISSAQGNISLQSNGQLQIYGRTDTYNVVEQLQYSHDLQKWNGSAWVYVTWYGRNTYNDDYVSGYDYYTPSVGYYRLACTNAAFDDSNTDLKTGYTDWIQVK